MSRLVRYSCEDSICTISLDDGKVNCMSPAMIAEINTALDQAESDSGVVLINGRPGIFSAGFDLREFEKGREAGMAMSGSGALLAERVFNFARPVVIACTGHAIAMGAFLLTAATVRVGADGPFKIGANEVAIGLNVPRYATELCRHRLAPRYLTRALLTAELFAPQEAKEAGFLDSVVAADAVLDEARSIALDLCELSPENYLTTQRQVRGPASKAIREEIKFQYN